MNESNERHFLSSALNYFQNCIKQFIIFISKRVASLTHRSTNGVQKTISDKPDIILRHWVNTQVWS